MLSLLDPHGSPMIISMFEEHTTHQRVTNVFRGMVYNDTAVQDIVEYWGRDTIAEYLDFALARTTDPLASLWTADNWRCWLDLQQLIPWLLRRHQRLLLPDGTVDEDAEVLFTPDSLTEVVGGLDLIRKQKFPLGNGCGGGSQERSGCAWKGCERLSAEGGVRLLRCRGCGNARYCGRVCQRSDWVKGGHKARCRRLKESRVVL
ncbi:unnamed protein product [Peniophora sp. CBMAI 1063]|nr:unnamed protein product [Peniophora sp. CBMAI 1063]